MKVALCLEDNQFNNDFLTKVWIAMVEISERASW